VASARGATRFVEVFVVEQFREPLVDLGEDRFFFDVDRGRVSFTVDGIVARHLAAVVGLAVVPTSLHAPAARATTHEPGENVVTTLDRCAVRRPPPLGGRRLGGVPQLVADEWLVRLLLGTDPVVLVVPTHTRVMTERDVVHVEEDLVAFLAVPHLVAEVARVLEDRSDRGVSPCRPVLLAVRVPVRVARAGGEDPFRGERRCDRVQSFAADELTEVAAHDRSSHRIGFEPIQTATVAGFARIRVTAPPTSGTQSWTP